MTAPGSDEQITTELAEALAAADGCSGVSLLGPGVCRVCRARAAFLLPVVEAYATRKAAEALRAAAEKIRALADGPVPAIDSAFDAVVILRVEADRADALTATHPDHGRR